MYKDCLRLLFSALLVFLPLRSDGAEASFSPDNLVAVPREFPATITQYEKEALPLLAKRDYAKLEEMAKELRTSKKQISSGSWHLVSFYSALSGLPDNATTAQWQQRQLQLESWARANTNSITALTALADYWTSYASDARGGGWANTVSQQNFNLMRMRLARAGEILKRAYKLESKCPYYYTVAQSIALHSNMPRAQYEQMVAEGIALAPDYISLYFQKITYLQPRWHGKDPNEWHNYIKAEADKLGGEEGDLFYARNACLAHSMGFYDAFIRDSPVEWPRLKKGLEICLKRYPDSLWAKTRLCYFSGQKGEKQQAKKYFQEIGHQVDTSVWSKTRFLEDREWAFKP
ncbi:MAG TPA: hypothetical protein VGH19_12050 [Verrucomicrobiae bacterium]